MGGSILSSALAQGRLRVNSLDNHRIINSDDQSTYKHFIPPFSKSIIGANIIGESKGSLNYEKEIARMILISCAMFFGTNFSCVKILGDALDPSVASLLRFTLAALVFLPYLLEAMSTKSQLVLGGLEVGIFNALGYLTQAQSLQTSNAGTVAFICGLSVIVVPFLDAVFSGPNEKKVAWYITLLPALLAVAGVAILELGGTDSIGYNDLIAIGQPFFFGFALWRVEFHMTKISEKGDAQAFTGAMMVSISTITAIWCLFSFLIPNIERDTLLSSVSRQVAALNSFSVCLAIAWIGVVTTAITAFGESYAMKSLSATESTVLYSTESVWALVFAALVLKEEVKFNTIIGAILIMCACMVSILGASFGNDISIKDSAEEIHFNENSLVDDYGGLKYDRLVELPVRTQTI